MTKSSWKYRSIAAVSAAALLLTLASCSGKSDADKALESLQSALEQAPGITDNAADAGSDESDAGSDGGIDDGNADGAADGADDGNADDELSSDPRFEGVLHPGLIADIPMVDGQFDRGMAGTLTNGGTDYQGFTITTEMDTATAGGQARDALTTAGFTEKAYGTGASAFGEHEAVGIFERGERLIAVEVNSDGKVRYDVHEMPAGSYAEQQFVCEKVSSLPMLAGMMPMTVPLQTGEPLHAEQVDFAFLPASGVMHRVPADLASSIDTLHEVVLTAAGKDSADTVTGTAIGDAIDAAAQDTTDEVTAYCAG